VYIAIEGPIGVGKTTLTRHLARALEGEALFEVVEENPFLPLFYEDPERYAFKVQVFFLLSRYKQLEQLAQPRLFENAVIADYLFDKDFIFASLNLEGHEWDLYQDLYQSLAPRLPTPDLTICASPRPTTATLTASAAGSGSLTTPTSTTPTTPPPPTGSASAAGSGSLTTPTSTTPTTPPPPTG